MFCLASPLQNPGWFSLARQETLIKTFFSPLNEENPFLFSPASSTEGGGRSCHLPLYKAVTSPVPFFFFPLLLGSQCHSSGHHLRCPGETPPEVQKGRRPPHLRGHHPPGKGEEPGGEELPPAPALRGHVLLARFYKRGPLGGLKNAARGPCCVPQALVGCGVEVRTLDGRLLNVPVNDIVE